MAMKYIIVDNGMYSTPFLFNDATDHSEFARMVTHGRLEMVESAGFVEINGGSVQCYGHSTSLNMKAEEGDTKLVARFLNGD